MHKKTIPPMLQVKSSSSFWLYIWTFQNYLVQEQFPGHFWSNCYYNLMLKNMVICSFLFPPKQTVCFTDVTSSSFSSSFTALQHYFFRLNGSSRVRPTLLFGRQRPTMLFGRHTPTRRQQQLMPGLSLVSASRSLFANYFSEVWGQNCPEDKTYLKRV